MVKKKIKRSLLKYFSPNEIMDVETIIVGSVLVVLVTLRIGEKIYSAKTATMYSNFLDYPVRTAKQMATNIIREYLKKTRGHDK